MTTPPVTTPPAPRARHAIVTGGARGIGRAIAARLAADGLTVTILDVLAEDAAEAAQTLGGYAMGVDLANAEATATTVDAAIAARGGVDVLVNCAGIFRLTPLLEITPESWDSMLGINAKATMITMQRAAHAMIPAGSGTIINIASMAAKKGGAMEAHYAASKPAVVALTRAAALEWGEHGVRANAICPGYVLTDMGAATRSAEQVDGWTRLSPLGRLGNPDDVAALASFLASDESSYITGQALNLTGGMVMH